MLHNILFALRFPRKSKGRPVSCGFAFLILHPGISLVFHIEPPKTMHPSRFSSEVARGRKTLEKLVCRNMAEQSHFSHAVQYLFCDLAFGQRLASTAALPSGNPIAPTSS